MSYHDDRFRALDNEDSDYATDSDSLKNQSLTVPAGYTCTGCRSSITDKIILMIDDNPWHDACLKCCMCHIGLSSQTSCFVKNGNVYCRKDYSSVFGVKCTKCLLQVNATDWIRRARDDIYHLACFSCYNCNRQLSTGDEFALHNNRLLCKTHYTKLHENGYNSEDAEEKPKPKRIRTAFTNDQTQHLQDNFDIDRNPDGPSLDRIGQMTGLNKRVVQVWFQNARAKQKRQKHISRPVSSPDSLISESVYSSD